MTDKEKELKTELTRVEKQKIHLLKINEEKDEVISNLQAQLVTKDVEFNLTGEHVVNFIRFIMLCTRNKVYTGYPTRNSANINGVSFLQNDDGMMLDGELVDPTEDFDINIFMNVVEKTIFSLKNIRV